MSWAFSNAMSFNGDVSGWNTSTVTNMEGVFSSAFVFNGDVSGWDVSQVTNMYSMFNSASDFNQDLSAWCVSNIETQPASFDTLTDSWSKSRPVWGTYLHPKRNRKELLLDTEERTDLNFVPSYYIHKVNTYF